MALSSGSSSLSTPLVCSAPSLPCRTRAADISARAELLTIELFPAFDSVWVPHSLHLLQTEVSLVSGGSYTYQAGPGQELHKASAVRPGSVEVVLT